MPENWCEMPKYIPEECYLEYPVNDEQMKNVLRRWPKKGAVVYSFVSFDRSIGREITMEVDEYGNVWDWEGCETRPAKLPVSINKLRRYLEDLLREFGHDPAMVRSFENQYLDMSQILKEDRVSDVAVY
jgi:hypothetical protein